MSKSTIQELAEFGQSVWLDYINRPMLENGDLQKRIDNGLRGMTSNPSIFNQAIGSSADYDQKIIELKGEGKSAFEIYDDLTVRDIQEATDIFRSVYDKTDGLDGYVSLEINPLLATQIEEQLEEGVRLYKKVNRPNVMIKVPSTPQGFPVLENLIAEGINVNTTLIFSLEQYEKTAEAYIRGLQRLKSAGGDLSKVRSVASVFISRIDSAIDSLLDEKAAKASTDEEKEFALNLRGKAAVANSRIIFERAHEIFDSSAFQAFAQHGAHAQRVLWASTSTKNPAYSDIKYVTELISQPTVNTIPEPTLNAFVDHGEVKDAFTDDPQNAIRILDDLAQIDISIDDVCKKLLSDGCKSFDAAFEELLASVEKKAEQLSLK